VGAGAPVASVGYDGEAPTSHELEGEGVQELNLRRPESEELLSRSVEVIVGSVRHEDLLAHIGGGRAADSGGRSPIGVQALYIGGLGQDFAASRSFERPD
jgi:hypothetical protein